MANVMIDENLLDDRIKAAMTLAKERKVLARKVHAIHDSYKARRKPHDDRIAAIDAALAELMPPPAPTASEPAGSTEAPGDEN